MGLEELKGLNVVVTQRDKFQKYGILRGFDAVFIEIEFADGSVKFIPLSNVANVERNYER